MKLNDYISDLKIALTDVGDNPLTVVEGPIDFALNTQGLKSFICVSETELGNEPYNTEKVYSAPLSITVGICVEKAPRDNEQKHLIRARGVFDSVYPVLGNIRLGGFKLMRGVARRETSTDPSEVRYNIECVLHLTEYESCQ